MTAAAPATLWPNLRFEDEEYARRAETTRAELERYGFDAAVLSDERTTWYFTGFGDAAPIGSTARPRILVFDREGPLTFFVHESTRQCVEEMVWEEIVVKPYRGLATPIDLLASALRKREVRTVGAELAGRFEPRLACGALQRLAATCDAVLVDASTVLWRVQAVKTPGEQGRIRRACQLTNEAYDAGFATVREGLAERDVAALFARELRNAGADGAWSVAVAGRGDYGRVDGVPRARPVRRSELLFVDMGANVGGYWADFSRAGVIGGASAHQLAMQEAIWQVTCAGVEALGPGVAVAAVADHLDTAMGERGLAFNTQPGRYGHGLGMRVTEPPDISTQDDTILLPGMVITIEPGTFDDEGIYHCEQDVLITEDGTDVLSRSDWRLRELG